MTKERTITISESEYDEIIEKLVDQHVDHNSKSELITYFILDALMIRYRLFYGG